VAVESRAEYQAKRQVRTLPLDNLSQLSEHLAWHHSAALTGLNVKWDGEGYFVILKALVGGNPMVHFTGGRSFGDAIEALIWEVQKTSISWRPDKYAEPKY